MKYDRFKHLAKMYKSGKLTRYEFMALWDNEQRQQHVDVAAKTKTGRH